MRTTLTAVSCMALAAAGLLPAGAGLAQAPAPAPPETAPLAARVADVLFRAPLRATFPQERPSWGELGFALRGVRWDLAPPDPVPAPGAQPVTVRKGYGPGSGIAVEATGDPGGVASLNVNPVGRLHGDWTREILVGRGARLDRLACRAGEHRGALTWYRLSVPDARPVLLTEQRKCTNPRAKMAPRCSYSWRLAYGAGLTPPAGATSTPEQCADPGYVS